MITPRAMANQCLYYAAVQLTAWQQALTQARTPAHVLDVAFGAAVCEHQRRAYGWFLLSLAGETNLPEAPPARVSELAAPAVGEAVSNELQECALLERQGFIAELLAAQLTPTQCQPKPRHSLAVEQQAVYSFGLQSQWQEALGDLFERLSQTLDEW